MSKKAVYREVINEFKNNKLRNETIIENRKNEVYKINPELKDIHKEIQMVGFKISMQIIYENSNTENFINNLEKEQNYLLKREKEILLENGYPENYFTDIAKCENCNDTGFIDNRECHCFKQKIIEKYYDMSNIKDVLSYENFDNFNIEFFSHEINTDKGFSPRANIERIYKLSTEFVDKFPEKFDNFLFYGPTGRGKTYMCNCIAKDILDKGYSVLYSTAPELFKILENYRFYRDEMENPDYYISLISDVDLLIIDDLGTEVSTKVTSSELFNIINTRMNREKHTIVSTNLNPKDFESYYSHRVESRFIGAYNMVEFIGKDIRIAKKYKS